MKEPELLQKARTAFELAVKESELRAKADAIVQHGIPVRGRPNWKEDLMNMSEDNMEFEIKALRTDVGDIGIVFDSFYLSKMLVLPRLGSAKVFDLEGHQSIHEILEGKSGIAGIKAGNDDFRQFNELIEVLRSRPSMAESLFKPKSAVSGHLVNA